MALRRLGAARGADPAGLRRRRLDALVGAGLRPRTASAVRPRVRARRVDDRRRVGRGTLGAAGRVGAPAEGLARHSRRCGARRRAPPVLRPLRRRQAEPRVRPDPGRVEVSLRDEAVQLLQELIRLNTVNPPGNETLAAELLRDYLEPFGVECELYAREPERANLVARIPGQGEGPSLLLLSHTDTVLADPAEWTVDPWSGELRDGEVWGRGALDMKSQVAANAVAIASLAREGFSPAGDLIFAATADEELGEGISYGLEWLCEAHPDAVRCDYAVNEGGGDRVEIGRRVLYLCAAAEKRSSPFVLHVHGRSGHGSMPGIADNALIKAAGLITRLGEFAPEPRLLPETEGFLRAITDQVPAPDDVLGTAREIDPVAAEMVEPLLGITVSPTIIHASDKRNVIPGRCD